MLRESSPDVRSFLTGSALLRQQACVPDSAGVDAALLAELDKLEAGGKPLLFSDAKGMAAFQAATAPLVDKAGIKGATEADLVADSAKEAAVRWRVAWILRPACACAHQRCIHSAGEPGGVSQGCARRGHRRRQGQVRPHLCVPVMGFAARVRLF